MSITVLYKPVVTLSALHVAVLSALRIVNSLEEVKEIVCVPRAVALDLVEDLKAWSLVEFEEGGFRLEERGIRFGQVIAATEGEGRWEFDRDSDWVLGEGSFSLPAGMTLSHIGTDVQEGIVVSEEFALIYVEEFQDVERQLDEGIVHERVAAGALGGADPEKLVLQLVDEACDWRQLRKICKLAQVSVDESEKAEVGDPRWFDAIRKALAEKCKKSREIMQRSRTLGLAEEVLLGCWLRQRTGLVGDLGKTEPWSFRVTSRRNRGA